MELVNSILVRSLKKRISQIDRFLNHPIEVQNEWFTYLIGKGRDTEWGKAHGYESIQTIREYQNQVPIQDYNSLKPFIDRAIKGEKNVLWPGETKWFAKSSGTTQDKSKFIPVTRETLETCHYKGGKDLISFYMQYKPDSRMFTGRGLVLGGSSEINQFNNQSYWGDLSSIIIDNLPFWAEFHRTPSKKITLMPEWEKKLEAMAMATVDQDVTTLAGVPSWTLVLLQKVLQMKNAKTISEVWPNLETYTHGGVSFLPYKKQFDEIMNLPGLSYMETYNASEGFFGLQDVYGEAYEGSLLLMLDYGIFYEFLPVEELESDFPKAITLDEVELGKNYVLLITTNSGLWRYNIGDTIMFTNLHPFRFRITGRTQQHINVFGEELMVDNTEKAIQLASAEHDCIVTDYTGCPVFMEGQNQGGHEWAIEFSKEPDNLEGFVRSFDRALQSLNSDYEAKRYQDLILRPPIVHKLAPGTFYNWLKKKGKLGGQNKVPRLSNSRKYVDEILAE
jgi:hypothetical protein